MKILATSFMGGSTVLLDNLKTSLMNLLGLRDCCRSIRIGKILVESDADTHEARVVYARFPDDIAHRQVLLMYPIMSTGNTVIQVRYIQFFSCYHRIL